MLFLYMSGANASFPPLLIKMEVLDWRIYPPQLQESIEQQIEALSIPGEIEGWVSHSVPSLVVDTKYWTMDGRLWYRLQFDAGHVADQSELGLLLGRVLEANSVWLNQKPLGSNGQVDRNGSRFISDVHSLRYYTIPAGLLVAKNNILLVEIQALSTSLGVASGPIGIAHSGPAWRYKASVEKPVLFAQGGLLVLILISLVVGLLTLVALHRFDSEHIAFVFLFLFAFIAFGIDSLMFYQSGLKTALVQRVSYVLGLAISIPLIIYLQALIGTRVSSYGYSLMGCIAICCISLFFVSALVPYWLIIALIFVLFFVAIIYVFIIGIPAVREGNLAVACVLLGILFLGLSVVMFIINDPLVFWLRSDELGMGGLVLSLLVAYILRLMSMQNQLRNMSLKLVNISEQERKHLARELHDGINQHLATIRLRLQMCAARSDNPELEPLSGALLSAMEEMDRVVQGLRPFNLEHHTLAQAMNIEVCGLNSVKGLNIDITAQDLELPQKLAQHLYRIFQESVQNSLKHADAKKIKVEFYRKRNRLTLSIKDDGSGFDAIKVQKNRVGVGMISLRERVTLIGGILHIESQKGKGTHIFVQVDEK